ncbi:MAG: alkaline phosphatase D [Myxococcota bacterium]|jgi:alkaline phosphatase D
MRHPLLLILLMGCPSGRDETSSTDVDTDTSNVDGDTDTSPVDGDIEQPTFPHVVDVVHVSVRTGSGLFEGSDADVTLCLSASTCLPLNHPEFSDRERDALDVYSFEGVGIARGDIDRVSLTLTDGADNQWKPVCVDVRLDGEAVHCRDGITAALDDDRLTWSDPDGLSVNCQTCSPQLLTHGPMVGALTPETATIWLRTDATRPVDVTATASAAGVPAPVVPTVTYPRAVNDFAATATLSGLQPGTEYRYSVAVDGQEGESFTFTTPPLATTPGQHRLAFGSCARFEDQPIFDAIATYNPDLFLFIGDNHYGNTTTLADSRQYYRWSRERGERADFLHNRSILATWDDHDFAGDNSDGTSPARAMMLRTFLENWANPSAGTPNTPGTFFQHSWGDVDVFMLDTRYHRGLDGALLGPAQEQWLLDGLAASNATFKLIASGTQFTAQGSNDSWASFPSDRNALLQGIVARNVDGVVLLSGDIHRTEFRRIPAAPGGYDVPELTSSPLANFSILPCGSDSEQEFCESGGNFFVGLDIDTTLGDPTLTATAFNESGAVRHVWTVAKSSLTLP